MKRVIFVILLLVSFGLSAQRKDNEKLAMQYYDQGEFEKAIVYLEDLYPQRPEYWFSFYFRALLNVKDYNRAEKIARRQIKGSRNAGPYYVSLGKVLRLQGDEKKEKESYEKAVKELNPIQPYVGELARAFTEEKLFDQAIQVYDKARRANPDYPYFYERAEVYKSKNDLAAMINEYLDAIEFRDTELQMVQIQLQNSLGYDDDEGGMKNPLLKQELIKRIQKDPGRIALTELLIFIQKQQKDFDGAYIQSRALDKRLKESGQRLFELAKIAEANGRWEIARKCYEYVIEKGPDGIFYDASTVDILNVEFLAVTSRQNPQQADLLQLEQRLLKAHGRFKGTALNMRIVKSLATIEAFYLGKTDDATRILQEYINSPGMDPQSKAEFKLMLGDIYLVSGEIWEASLLYSQVEKAYKFEAIGHEAKFRNAKLSYYAGDFKWAKTQADVLKGSVEKLIANDALDLSLIISDAIGVDTNDAPLKMFSSAELMILQHKYDMAIARMDSINLLFSNHTLGDDIFFKKAVIYRQTGRNQEAESMYRNIVEYYPDGLYGDDAQFNLAELYELYIGDKEKAKEAYEQVLKRYPGSIFTVEARKRFRQLRGDAVNN